MSTRSAINKRNQEKLQGASGSGMARKSTSSAKPARPAGGSVRVVPATAKAKRAAAERGEDLSNLSKEEKKARKAELRREEDRIYTASSQLMKEDEDYSRYRRIWWVLLVIGIVAFIFDFIKIRPIRNACRDKAAGMTAAKLDDVIARSMAPKDKKQGK